MEALLPLLVFLTIVTLGLVIVHRYLYQSQQEVIQSRLLGPSNEDMQDVDIMRAVPGWEPTSVGGLLSKLAFARRLQVSLWQAGLYASVTDALALMVALIVAGDAAAALWAGGFSLFSLIFGVITGLSPLAYITWRKQRRLAAFDQQLPEILDMLKSSLNVGHTLQRALQVTVEHFDEPASSEFRIALEQNRLGVPLAQAFEYMLQRIPNENLRFLATAIRVQSESGSSLAGIIGILSGTIRDRQRVDLKIKTLTAQPRMTGLIVGLMPVILLIIINFLHHDFVNVLFVDPMGQKLLKTAAAFEVIALIVIRRMMRVDY
jgi:tight adherence protein B